MKVLVTGVTGRFGPYLVQDLEEAGHEVVLFARRKPPAEFDHLEWVEGDIRDFEACKRAVAGRGLGAIHHAAAQPYPTDHPAHIKEDVPIETTMQSNIMGTYYLLQAALADDVGIFVMTGSNCALGHGYRISDRPFPFEYLPVDEEHPSDVEDSYSFSKLTGEHLLESYTKAYGMKTYAVRSAGIRNPEQRVEMAKNVKPAKGWNPWLWVWVGSEDVASAHRILMEKAAEGSIESHGAYFCNADDSHALEPTHELIEKFRPDLLPLVRELEGHAALMSTKKLQAVGWQHKTSWREHLDS
jgi:UDP-glucose 4-epimerase